MPYNVGILAASAFREEYLLIAFGALLEAKVYRCIGHLCVRLCGFYFTCTPTCGWLLCGHTATPTQFVLCNSINRGKIRRLIVHTTAIFSETRIFRATRILMLHSNIYSELSL